MGLRRRNGQPFGWINQQIQYMGFYPSVRHCIEATWLIVRDQFLYLNNGWESDVEFQNDCLAYTLFSNNIQSKYGVNHWIPFTEYQVNARYKFKSRFMTDYIAGKIEPNDHNHPVNLFTQITEISASHKPELSMVADPPADYKTELCPPCATPRLFSPDAQNLCEAGRKLWSYYHAQPHCDVNAGYYDIRAYFQGRNSKGVTNTKSNDETYNELIGALRLALKSLGKTIEPKVYEYGLKKTQPKLSLWFKKGWIRFL